MQSCLVSYVQVIRAALEAAGTIARQVSGNDMHGTGTPLGDPIEVGAIAAVLQVSLLLLCAALLMAGQMETQGSEPAYDCLQGQKDQILTLTAAKSRMGHSETGAGVLGMLHASMQLTQQVTNMVAHLRMPNNYVISTLQVSDVSVFMPRQTAPRQGVASVDNAGCTGVSAFAFQVNGKVFKLYV